MEAKTMTLVERLADFHLTTDLAKADLALISDAISLLEAAEKALKPFANQNMEAIEHYPAECGVSVQCGAYAGGVQLADLRLARSVRDKIKGINNPVDPTPGESNG